MDASPDQSEPCSDQGSAPRGLLWLLVAAFAIRAVHAGQPIVENYVGRQVPTAMVARNLERGSGFLRPRLDTAPFPNYFVVEPPIYERCAVALKWATGLGLGEAGRLVSAAATTLAAWGIFGLARRREGRRAALLAVTTFAVFPLTIRYGRAFQPDALALGASCAGLACWDRYREVGRRPWMVIAWVLLAAGFAVKITAGFLLVPLLAVVRRPGRRLELVAACATLVPAGLWYAWALWLLAGETGSRASADNQAFWLEALGPVALAKLDSLRSIGWAVFVRAFTPLGAALAVAGFLRRAPIDRLWCAWTIGLSLTMLLLGAKLHHEYYWLPLAPLAAVGVGRMLDRLCGSRPVLLAGLSLLFLVMCWAGARSTWVTPGEWKSIESAGRSVAATVPFASWVAAPEALLFEADRRGCRMEWTSAAAARAAGEWGAVQPVETPLDLLEFYRRRGARYFADLGGPPRKGLHDAVRRRYKVMVDTPEVIIAELADPEVRWNAN
jgi:4-amino-4-deoxy-L-arabinose transferase-like glycosyltransferase